jgi:hypothetical protein
MLFRPGCYRKTHKRLCLREGTESFVQTSGSPLKSFSLLAFATVFSNSNLMDNAIRKLLFILRPTIIKLMWSIKAGE